MSLLALLLAAAGAAFARHDWTNPASLALVVAGLLHQLTRGRRLGALADGLAALLVGVGTWFDATGYIGPQRALALGWLAACMAGSALLVERARLQK